MASLEVLVLSLCLGEYECSTALKALYETKPVLKQNVKEASKVATKRVGKPLSIATPALYMMIVKHELNLRVTRNLTLISKPDTIKLVYGFTF